MEKVIVHEKSVNCDGGAAELGHPKVYLEIGSDNEVICPYCSKVFVYQEE
jgi:uncharacterized Zn-finger protein